MAYYDFKTSEGAGKAYYLGELNHGATMDVASKYADYANLTKDNFIIVPKTSSSSGSYSDYYDHQNWDLNWRENFAISCSSQYNAPSKNYNPANGQLSFTSTVTSYGRCRANQSGGWWEHIVEASNSKGLKADVYLLPEIENL